MCRHTYILKHLLISFFLAAALDLISKNANSKENKIALKLEKKVKKLEKVTATGALRVLDFNKVISSGEFVMHAICLFCSFSHETMPTSNNP